VVVTLRPALLNSVDKVLILRAGRVEAFGPPSQVLHRVVRGTGTERVTPVPTQASRAGESAPAGAASNA
jgi:ATP-binding cassette, subfamily C, bacterial